MDRRSRQGERGLPAAGERSGTMHLAGAGAIIAMASDIRGSPRSGTK